LSCSAWRVGAALGVLAITLAACATAPQSSAPPAPAPVAPNQTPHPPVAPESVPDAVPRVEPRSRYGNPPFYEVFGKRYYVMPSSVGYVERGVASWYGPGFHEIRTSTGEPYDMYGMTAAHKTLPLPAYVRVTNLSNGRSIVVRVNDRGPFVGNRIIDLSYTAAAKLDMLRNGTAFVEVRALDPTQPNGGEGPTTLAQAPAATQAPTTLQPAVASAPDRALYIQAGAFSDPANAERLAAKLRGGGYDKVFVREDSLAGRTLFRVRIGPVPDVAEFDRLIAALDQIGIKDAHLALD
jgi:rare lipoprotein A